MYCPSCDKSYGATHSRCPECHSWLKISAPSGATQSRLESGGVSTLEREPEAISWSTPDSSWLSDSSEEVGRNQGETKSGWLAEPMEDSSPTPAESSSGWLGTSEPEAESGRGWLVDGPSDNTEPKEPSLLDDGEDEFLDDSWVDEEILDDFSELDEPLYDTPSSDVGGTFLKLMLTAVLVVLVGGGILFMKSNSKSPEQLAEEKRANEAKMAAAYILDAENELKLGNPALAAPLLEDALVTLSELKAPAEEIDSLELKLSQALMQAEEYEDAIKHWNNLVQSPHQQTAVAAKDGLGRAKRAKRLEANALLAEAKKNALNGGTHSARGLAREALSLYQEFDGSEAQLGDTNGVIGLTFFNAQENGTAEVYFEKAVRLAPQLGYKHYLAKVRLKVQPAPRNPRPNQPTNFSAPPVFDPGTPDYQTNTNRPVSRPTGPRPNNPPPAQVTPEPPRMQEIPTFNRKPDRNDGKIGDDGVVPSYNRR